MAKRMKTYAFRYLRCLHRRLSVAPPHRVWPPRLLPGEQL